MARGGRRQGRAGANYSQRSDLQLGARLPVQAAPGQVYGAAGNQRAAQQAVPLVRPGTMPPSPAAAPAAPPRPLPPSPLDSPTANPGEPLTAGLAQGPGPGPEALTAAPDPQVAALGVLNSLGNRLSPALRSLRDHLNAQGTNLGTP